MVDTKKALQDGVVKSTIVLVETRDINGKLHYVAFDDAELAKKYKCSGDTLRQVTMFTEVK